VAAEVKDVFGPGETGPDEWGARKDVQHQAEADLRRRIAWTLAKWRAIIFHDALRKKKKKKKKKKLGRGGGGAED